MEQRWVKEWGSLFYDMASPSLPTAPKVILERKHKPLPQVNSSTGPSHLPSPNGSMYKTKGCGTAGLFCTRCLSMGDLQLSSQFKKLYEYIVSTVKFLGDVS